MFDFIYLMTCIILIHSLSNKCYFIFKAIFELVYNGSLVYFPQGGTCVSCPPFCALMAAPCLLFCSIRRLWPSIIVL